MKIQLNEEEQKRAREFEREVDILLMDREKEDLFEEMETRFHLAVRRVTYLERIAPGQSPLARRYKKFSLKGIS